MFYNAKNGKIDIGETDMDYVTFGNGNRNLIMIPGLGDGLKTVKGTAIPMALSYRSFASTYKVYVLSRKNQLDDEYTTREMAADYKIAMDTLGITKADVLGISQGGMIAQYFAIDYPEIVEKLVLAVTISRQNETVQSVIGTWLNMAKSNDYKSIFVDITEKAYTEKHLRKYRRLYSLVGTIGKQKDFTRFNIQAKASLKHDAYNELDKIKCPTLVIGVENDITIGANTSEEIAERIENNKLIIYKDYGHAVYEEAKDFNQIVLDFLQSTT
ncbi:MAG: alpha/beta hydrolase [Oscillospiraceae bacterium]|nr:alpha/beta hydrolase [Oscillospiraceae bacterium]